MDIFGHVCPLCKRKLDMGHVPNASAMISHDCTPNVVRYINGFEGGNLIHCYASRDIPKGEKLSITYVDLLQPGLIRRDVLKKVGSA